MELFKRLYFIEFLKGITVYGALELAISLLIIYQVKTDLDLGIRTSIFSCFMIITMFLFAKIYHKERSNKFILNLCGIIIFMSFVWMLFSMSKTTIILYNIVYYTIIQIVFSITEIRLFDYSNKPPFKEELNTEYFIVREVVLNVGRIIGYVILLLVGMSHNLELLKILFLLGTIALISIVHMNKKLNQEEIQENI